MELSTVRRENARTKLQNVVTRSMARLLERVADLENYQLAEVFKVDINSETWEIALYQIRPPKSQSDGPATRFVPTEFEGRSYPPVRSR